MKPTHLLAAIVLAASSAPASAADVAPEPAPYDWTGAYAGVFGSYSSGTVDGQVIGSTSDSFGIDGVQAGVLAGYNLAFRDAVLGIEVDAAVFDVDGEGFGGGVNDFNVSPVSHLRGRIGLPFDRVLPYVAAGLTLADADARIAGFGDPSHWHFGFNIGAGLDVALSDHLVLRAEYIFDNLSDKTYTYAPADIDFGWTSNTVRLGAIWRF